MTELAYIRFPLMMQQKIRIVTKHTETPEPLAF